jgi:1,4-alpha-glucan branching enzyme
MGARKYNGGIGFRVWAPNAQSVSVIGDFNNWSTTANVLTSENNGYWSTDVPGAQIGQRYRYFIVNHNSFSKNDPYARELTENAADTVIHDPDFDWESDAFTMPAWNELVIYELHIGTFSSLNGRGKFQGVIDKLGYLQDLGINAIEIMASGEFATDRSWGYNPVFIHAIETSYGGIKEFKRLVKAAHQHGIAVIFDVVYNHLGLEGLDIWRFDGWSENNKGGIYFYNDARSHTPWGDTRPNYGRGEVRQYLHDNALMWLEKRHVDGLRWDATRFIHTIYGDRQPENIIYEGWSLMQWINNEIKNRQPWKISIAEDLHNNPRITADTSTSGAGFDSQWDSVFVNTIRAALTTPSDEMRNLFAVRDAIGHRYNPNHISRVIYTESHDEVAKAKTRLPTAVNPQEAESWYSKKRSTLGAALVFTAPGIPMIFQGQEFLETAPFDDWIALDWSKSQHFSGISFLYRDLIRLRRNWHNNTRGLRGQYLNIFHLNDDAKLLAFHRWENSGAGDDVIIIINLSINSFDSYTIGFPRGGIWRLRFNSDWNGYSSDFGNHSSSDVSTVSGFRDGMFYQGNISIGPYSALIFSQG